MTSSGLQWPSFGDGGPDIVTTVGWQGGIPGYAEIRTETPIRADLGSDRVLSGNPASDRAAIDSPIPHYRS